MRSARSRWTLALLLLVVTGVCVRLGLWQYRRLVDRRAANAIARERAQLPALKLGGPDSAGHRPAVAGRRLDVVGRYDRSQEVVIRGIALREVPGVYIITPLLVAGDSAVLVNRGFVPSPDATTADLTPFDDPGEVRVTGTAIPLVSLPDSGRRVEAGGHATWARLDLAALRRRVPYPVLDVVLLASPDSQAAGSIPRRISPPVLDDGPHLSYMLQWFGFAVTAVVFAGIVLWRRPDREPPPA